MSIDLFCMFFLILFFFGLAISVEPHEDCPRQVPWYVTRNIVIDWEEE